MKLHCTQQGLILYPILILRTIFTAITTTVITIVVVVVVEKEGSEREEDLWPHSKAEGKTRHCPGLPTPHPCFLLTSPSHWPSLSLLRHILPRAWFLLARGHPKVSENWPSLTSLLPGTDLGSPKGKPASPKRSGQQRARAGDYFLPMISTAPL